MKLDYAIEKEEKGINNPSDSSNSPKTVGNDQSDGKKCDNNRSDRHDDKRVKSGSHDKHPKYELRFTNYTTLSASRPEVYLATYQDVPYRKPPPIRKERSERDINKFCCFHGDYGHDTNECNHLKDEIEFLLRSGKLTKFRTEKPKGGESNNNTGFKRHRFLPLELEPVDFTMDTICGGPQLARDNNKTREKYARAL